MWHHPRNAHHFSIIMEKKHSLHIPAAAAQQQKPLLMANWKMQFGIRQAQTVAAEIVKATKPLAAAAEIVLCPSFTALPGVSAILTGSHISLGAQDVFWEDEGQYTGEVSVRELRELGCQYVIIGHSERREHVGETDEMIQRKTAAVIRQNLIPILCIGETAEDRRQGREVTVVTQQVQSALASARPPFKNQRVVVTYEPKWAISPNPPCDPAEAKRMAEVIVYALLELYDLSIVRNNFLIAYGGSAGPENVRAYIDFQPIGGVLIGAKSLQAATLAPMVEAFMPRRIGNAPQRSAKKPQRFARRRRSTQRPRRKKNH